MATRTQLKSLSPSVDSYEETFRTAYSHGLEEIYSLETVDLKSIRPISPIKKEEEPSHPVCNSDSSYPQLTLDLGEHYRDWVRPFFSQEPIQVLQRVYSIEFRSLLRVLFDSVEKTKLYCLLKTYALEDVCDLLPLEKIKVRNIDLQQVEQWKLELQTPLLNEKVNQAFVELCNAFIIPWIRKRSGLATQRELIERLQRISDFPKNIENVLSLFKDFYFKGSFPLSQYLIEIEKGLFASDSSVAKSFEEVCMCAQGYFYRPEVRYDLNELLVYLNAEFAAKWKNYSKEFLEKVLRYSSRFRVRRGERGLFIMQPNGSRMRHTLRKECFL